MEYTFINRRLYAASSEMDIPVYRIKKFLLPGSKYLYSIYSENREKP
jgi:hypothetical protein